MLSWPGRVAIVRRVVRDGPATVADLAEAAGTTKNGIQHHLAILVSTGILVRNHGRDTTYEASQDFRERLREAVDWLLGPDEDEEADRCDKPEPTPGTVVLPADLRLDIEEDGDPEDPDLGDEPATSRENPAAEEAVAAPAEWLTCLYCGEPVSAICPECEGSVECGCCECREDADEAWGDDDRHEDDMLQDPEDDFDDNEDGF